MSISLKTCKQSIRKSIRKRRQALSPNQQHQAAQALLRQVSQWQTYVNSQNVAFYSSFDAEINPHLLLKHAQQQEKNCYLPVVVSDQLKFMPCQHNTTLIANRYGILEPEYIEHQCIVIDKLDLVFVPLLAFDLNLHRIGMGAGYYDKSFAFLNDKQQPQFVGLAYDWQRVSAIDKDPWDVDLNTVITDKKIY